MIKDAPFERLRAALIARTGHAYYEGKDKLLHDRVRERMQARGVGSLSDYLETLEREEEEWRALEDVITIGETYFFRYADHFEALRRTILPDLIARKSEERSLRIWSIGCANGAEPYSVAIVVHELLGAALPDWRVVITGGDISERALAAAREARYGAWALRTVSPEDRAQYFMQSDARTWTLKPEYRALVRFERQNILELLTPSAPLQWSDFDLILCRNVLIYFTPAHAVDLVKALRARLAPGGVLLLGHAEATLAADPALVLPPVLATEFGQALRPSAEIQAPPAWEPLALPPPRFNASQSPPAPPAPASEVTLEDVRRLADAGAYERAQLVCDAVLQLQPMSAQAHYYKAILNQVCDDFAGAEAALRRALYLDRNFALAHHRLGLLLLAKGRAAAGRRALVTAERIAASLPNDAPLQEGGGVTAGAFSALVRAQMQSAPA